jgi:polysaccharide chain length determinant protein (PEP-CTERM system associated)
MIQGQQFKPEDLAAILRRRAWLLVLPTAVFAAVTAMVVRQLPDRYQSEAVVLVVPQQVAQALVRSTVTTRLDARLQALAQQILSRTRLERIIEELNLFTAERRSGLMEDLVTKVRSDIKVAVVKGDSFKVTYEGADPRAVQQVTARVASLFIEESLRDRAVLAEGTDQFLEVQLDDARRRLVEHEKKLEAYRMQYSGQMPTQLGGNLQALQNTQMQIQATLESMNRDRDQQLLLQRQLADLDLEATANAEIAAATPTTASTPDEVVRGSTAKQLEAARNLLAQLQLRYKAEYPEIPRTKRLIRDLEAKLDAEALGRPVGGGETTAGLSPKEQARLKRVADAQAQLALLEKRIAESQATEARLRTKAADYQQKIDMVPARESELTELTRDYSTLQDTYKNLLHKKEESGIAANLERRQIGEQFKLLEPARVPDKPSSPNRPLLTAIGMAAGLVIGVFVIVLLEYKDTSFATDDEIAAFLELPVLAVVPAMQSDAERRRETARRWILGFGFGSTVLGCLAIVAYTLVR